METINPNKKEKWKKVRKIVKGSGIAIFLLVAIPIIGFASVYNIQEQEQAVLYHGKGEGNNRSGTSF
ncbi:MAG: hypothetical protein QM683_06895 [Lacrimispora sp.]